nr:MAG TPA: hypothetical protein [Caudoviricetes sp.]
MGRRLQRCSRFFHVVCLLRLGGFRMARLLKERRREHAT